MKVGDMVLDRATGDIVMIISNNPRYSNAGGGTIAWDFEVLSSMGIYCMDKNELEVINESR